MSDVEVLAEILRKHMPGELMPSLMRFVIALDEERADVLATALGAVITLNAGGWRVEFRRDKRFPCPCCGSKGES